DSGRASIFHIREGRRARARDWRPVRVATRHRRRGQFDGGFCAKCPLLACTLKPFSKTTGASEYFAIFALSLAASAGVGMLPSQVITPTRHTGFPFLSCRN